MAPHFGPNKKSVSGSEKKPAKAIGQLRKTQMITTFGSGAIADMPDYSVIMAGINQWHEKSLVLHEPNLEKLLKVSKFKEPYVSDSSEGKINPDVPAYRFPYFCFCPACGRLMPYWGFGDKEGKTCNHGHPAKKIVPSRFVAACINGHIEDFPYDWWVHHGDFSECPAQKRNTNLKISFSDKTSGLESIIITCTACGKSRTMAGCMSREALLGYSCKSKRPWLGKKNRDDKECRAPMRVLLRGASNVYFPLTVSALTIPPRDNQIQKIIAQKWDCFRPLFAIEPDDQLLGQFACAYLKPVLDSGICTLDELVSEIRKYHLENDLNQANESDELYTKQNLLEDEYRVLCQGNYDDPNVPQFKIARTDVPEFLQKYIEDIVLAKRLKEVMALRGFRRIVPDQYDPEDMRYLGYNLAGDYVPLSDVPLGWLPAIEMLGEGIFIRIKEDTLKEWESKYEEEYAPMKARLEKSNVGCDNFSARYVLLHTLSHLLIRQLSLECGYSGATIKERIYSTYPDSDIKMSGILLYTSSSDSDGSLGGLVRKGLPDTFEMIFKNMLQEASWCSSDPICIESHAQGYDSLNFAACHACALLPETSCEMRNCLLDRAAIVGTLQNRDRGFFGELL